MLVMRRWLVCALLVCGVGIACTRDPQAAKQQYLESGDRYLADGKPAEALIQYRNAVQRVPLDGEARVKLADAYMAAREYASATEEYVRAADLRPEDTDLQLKAGRLLFLAGRFSDSRAIAEKVIARDGGRAEAYTLLANSLAGLRDFDAAVSQLEEAIKLNAAPGEMYSNLGTLELGRGQKQAAEAAFLKAIELEPNSTTAHLALANFYWADNRREPAQTHLKTVLEIDPQNVLAHRALATLYVATQRRAEAEGHLKKIVELTKVPAASVALAEFYAAQGNLTAARDTLQPLAQDPVTAAAAEVRLAALDHAAGRQDDAYARLDSILAKDGSQLDVLLARASLFLADRRLDEAFKDATVATEKHPTSAEALFALGRVQTARSQREAAIGAYEGALRLNPRALDAKLALARLHLSAGRVDASLGLAREVVGSEPKSPAARITVSRALLARDDLRGAEHELNALEKEFPDWAEVHVHLGLLNRLKRNEPAARSHFERALALQPGSAEAFAGLVALDVDAKRQNAVRARVDQRLAAHANDTTTLLVAARAFATLGDAPKAEEALRRVILIDPNLLDAYAMLAQLLVRQQRLDAALAEFDALAKRDPRPVAALTFAGVILQVQGKLDLAVQRFQRALEFDPEAAVAANNLAWIYASDGKLDAALPLAQTARRGLPDNPSVTNTLGFVYYKKDMLTLAIPELSASVEKAPDNPTYNHHLGLAYAKAGERPQAIQHLRRALQLKADFDGAAEARAVLNSLDAGPGQG